ncbi:hypothetical protein L1999_18180 [Neobacillus drentensis]|nr:hypothetical protein [Neobacillus drentensis]ULT55052.1 hypothetical protein L1999_18180 [Neobacillus drentensis]
MRFLVHVKIDPSTSEEEIAEPVTCGTNTICRISGTGYDQHVLPLLHKG